MLCVNVFVEMLSQFWIGNHEKLYLCQASNFTEEKWLLWYFCDDGVAQFRQSLCKGDAFFEIATRVKSRGAVARRKDFPKNSFFAICFG